MSVRNLLQIKLTNACVLLLGLVAEMVSVEVGDFPQLFRLVFVAVDCIFVQTMLDSVRPNFVICSKRMQAFQCLGPASEVVVDFELLPLFGQLLKFS